MGIGRFQYDFGLLGNASAGVSPAGGYYAVCRVVDASSVEGVVCPDYINLPDIEFAVTPCCPRCVVDVWCYPHLEAPVLSPSEAVEALGEITEGGYTTYAWRWYFLGADRKSEYVLVRSWKFSARVGAVCYRWLFDLSCVRSVFNAGVPVLSIGLSTGQVSRSIYLKVDDGFGSV